MSTWCSPDVVLLGSDCPLPLDLPFTPAQAERDYGVSRRRLRTLVGRGLVRQVVRGVYAAAQAPNDVSFRAAALHLVISPSAVATDRTAAWLHGVDLQARSSDVVPVSFFQKPGTRARRSSVESGERRLARGDVVEIDGLSVTSPLRTAMDLGRLLWRFDALAALDQFLRLGVSHDEMVLETARFKGYRGVLQLRAFVAIADGRAESVAESALRLHWYDAGLPRPEVQWWVHDHDGIPRWRLDLALPKAMFAAEYDGAAFHSSESDRAHDLSRREFLGDLGWHLEVFRKEHVYARGADPAPRLKAGLVTARRALGTRPQLTGQRLRGDHE